VLRCAVVRRQIDSAVVEQIGRLFIPISAILDVYTHLAGHELQDAIRAHHQALAAWLRQAASWMRSGERAGEIMGSLPKEPSLSGPGDHIVALVTWYGVLHQDIHKILEEVGPQAQLR